MREFALFEDLHERTLQRPDEPLMLFGEINSIVVKGDPKDLLLKFRA